MKPSAWHNCYDLQWKGLITDESFSHPAKFSRGLIERIIRHGLERGYWQPGDVLGDPFGGVGTTGLVGAYMGLRVVSVELEPRFLQLSYDNFYLHMDRLQAMGEPLPAYLGGDSRNFAQIVKGAAGICTSPPYADQQLDYGDRPNRAAKIADNSNFAGRTHWMNNDRTTTTYGQTEGQIGSLKEGDLAAVVTSPPYADSGGTPSLGSVNKDNWGAEGKDICSRRGLTAGYGQTEGQIGNAAGETYWAAMRTVYQQCLLALPPDGYLACVIKDYVKAKKRIPLSDQTLELLIHLGFQPVERVKAMLVKEHSTGGLFGEITTKTERKSFFRRLAEAKGSPRIDWEDVLFVRKP